MPVTEASVAITELLGHHRPFRAVLKQKVSDFIVNEIALSGEVVTLSRLAEAPPPPPPAPKRPAPDPEATPSSPSALPLPALDALFPPSTPASALLTAGLATENKEITLPPTPDKSTRGAVHAWVRNHLPTHVSDTVVAASGEQAVRLRPRAACRPWKRRRGDGRPDARHARTFDPRDAQPRGSADRGGADRVARNSVVRFVLCKRNADTMDALSQLSRVLHIPPTAFTFAGTKDKRAVTTQHITVRGVSEGRLAHANRMLARHRGKERIVVGDVKVLAKGERGLGLGDLKGNRFTIVLRDLDISNADDKQNVQAAVESVRERGFVNYFGLQRFGSGVSGTHETGFAFLRADFEEVCRRILLPLVLEEWEATGDGVRPERMAVVAALREFKEQKITAKELMQRMPKWMHIERAVVASFCLDESKGISKYDYRNAFDKLPRNMRRMYGHAVQSYLWNAMASARIRMCRPDHPSRLHAIEGDIVCVDVNASKDLNYQTGVRTITALEEKNKSVSVFRVLVPVLGSEVGIPDMAYGDEARSILAREKVDLQSGFGSEYGMKGTYRFLLSKPEDVEMDIVSYSDGTEIMVPMSVIPSLDSTKSPAEDADSKDVVAKQVAEDGSEAHTEVPAPTKIQRTEDLMTKEDGPDDDTRKEIELNTKAHQKDKKSAMGKGSDGDKKALVVSFSLGCGQYATMLVRELTRMDSATANQKAMQNAVSFASAAVKPTAETPPTGVASLSAEGNAIPS